MKRYRIVCDVCLKDINDSVYINASSYGREFHILCWQELRAPEINRLLGLGIKTNSNEP